MLDNLLGGGKLEKMIIRAYKPQVNADDKPELSDAEEDKYMVQVNPETYQVNYTINYDRQPAMGNSGSEARYASTPPPALEFDFLFDGTGVIPAPAGPLDNVPFAGAVADLLSGGGEYDVMTELQKFAKVVYDYSGDEHRPRQIQITWGKLVFDGVLSSLQLTYKLFKADGTPLRAEAKASFDGAISDTLREQQEKYNSPDLTHKRTVTAGDNLPLMTQRIYGTPAYYLEVARVNKLFNFRKLSEGKSIFFPPVDKTKR